MEEPVKILCVDDEKNILRALFRMFMDEEYEILTAASGEEGLQVMRSEPGIQVVISDFRMPGMNGVDFLREVHREWPETVRIVLSGYADPATVVSAINEGQVYRFVPKPWNDVELRAAVHNAVGQYRLERKNAQLLEELRASNRKIQAVNESLERTVQERTSKILGQNRALKISQNTLDALPVAVTGIDTDGLIVCANQAGRDLFTREGEELLGARYQEVFPRKLLPLVEDLKHQEAAFETIALEGTPFRILGTRMEEEDQQGIILVFMPQPLAVAPSPPCGTSPDWSAFSAKA